MTPLGVRHPTAMSETVTKRAPTTAAELLAALDAFDWAGWRDQMAEWFTPLARDIIETRAGQVTDQFTFADPYASEVMTRYVGERIVQLDETTRKEVRALLQREFANWQAEGTTFDLGTKVLASVHERFDGYQRWRADRIARTECLLPETTVDAAVVGTAHRRWYDGEVVEIVTRDGRKFSTTPNHPMLTRRGWVASGLLRESDDLVCHYRKQSVGSSSDEYVDARPATIAQVFDSAAAVGICERQRGGQPDFHGDGRDSQIDTASPARPLIIGQFAALFEPLAEHIFEAADLASTVFCLRCQHLLSDFGSRGCLCHTADGHAGLPEASKDRSGRDANGLGDVGVGLAGAVPFNDVVVRQAHEIERLRTGTPAVHEQLPGGLQGPTNSGVTDPAGDGRREIADLCGHLRRAEAGEIQFDRVRSITRRMWSGHVYNLTTPFGYFCIQGGVYTGNTAIQSNIGTGLGAKSAGYTHVHVMDGDQDEECAAVNGTTQTVEWLLENPVAHPHCVRAAAPVVPD